MESSYIEAHSVPYELSNLSSLQHPGSWTQLRPVTLAVYSHITSRFSAGEP
jgi:hypothetical protein